MVTLPRIKEYSKNDIKRASVLSPALFRYLNLLETTPSNESDSLRLKRLSLWCQSAIPTLLDLQTPDSVCSFWSQESEALLSKTWKTVGLEDENVALFALGKLGAQELNLSSDIDLLFISDTDPTSEQLKKVRQWIKALSEVTAYGFCYRIDMDLRPGGAHAPLISSFDFFTNHYGYHGETWERMAMIRLKGITGPKNLINKVSEFCQKFAFRKHLDYSLFYDLQETREKLRKHHFDKSQLNLKFSPGGIRELELFIHALQLIHGGKNRQLITGSTTDAIQRLIKHQLIDQKNGDFLEKTYWFYRTLENKIQATQDQHTYTIPVDVDKNLIPPANIKKFHDVSQKVCTLVDEFLNPYQGKRKTTSKKNLNQAFDNLKTDNPKDKKTWDKLLHSEAKSKIKGRGENERRNFLLHALELIEKNSSDKSLAFNNLNQFVARTRAKSSFFSLFNKNEGLIDEIIWIFSYSPYLSQILIHRPELVDSFLIKSVDLDESDQDSFYNSIRDYKLLSDLIASSQFLKNRDLNLLTSNLSRTTETITTKLLHFLAQMLDTEPFRILTLGKWAAKEMGLKSDLDFVFISETPDSKNHIKLARRFINALQIDPSLYTIDLRLRPSGQAGPLLLSEESLSNYLNTNAMAWERQAYLKSRFLGETDVPPLYKPTPFSPNDLFELRKIRDQLYVSGNQNFDYKKSLGGITHTEFTLQLALMSHSQVPKCPSTISMVTILKQFYDKDLIDEIILNYHSFRTEQQLLTLLSTTQLQSFNINTPAFHMLCQLLQSSPEDKMERISFQLSHQIKLLQELDPL